MKSKILILVISFIAFTIHAQKKGATPIPTNPQQSNTKSTYAVVIGISYYQDPGFPDLHIADKDVKPVVNYLTSNRVGKLDHALFQLGLVYNLSKLYLGSSGGNNKVIQLKTKNAIAYSILACSLRMDNKSNEALYLL